MARAVNISRWSGQSAVLRYGLSVLAVIAATIIQHFGDMHFAVTPSFVCAVMISGWFGGMGSGLLATGLSILSLKYYFVPPTGTFTIDEEYIPSVILFSLVAFFVTWLSARERKAAMSLVYAHNQLDLKIREVEESNKLLQAEIATRTRATEELDELRSELAHVARVTMLGELAASIAHEINQPLAAIVINSSAGKRSLDGPAPDLDRVRKALARIDEDGKRAAAVIDRIRAMAKKSPTQMARLDANEVILSVIAMTRSEIERHRVTLLTDLDEDLPAARGDRVQLQQVVLNLVMNAIEAMATGETRELLVCSRGGGTQAVVVSVCDSGPGLDARQSEHLFEAFYTTKPNGMGMGLAICRSIMQAHAGRLTARPNEPRGAIFEVELPVERIKADSLSADA
jgi:C4-dicarboxylate-specific signal transduction histidine kinase